MAFGNIDLSRELVQSVRDAVDVVDLAGEVTRLQQKGRDWEGLCPFHKEKSPSFHVDPDKGLFYCFGCGVGGDGIKFHMLISGDDFPAAIESLATRYGITVHERRQRRADEPDPERALAAAEEFFVDQLGRAAAPRRYLEERRMPPELVERYGLGYAPESWTALCDALQTRVPARDLEAAGLIGKSRRDTWIDRFRHRLMFPIHNPAGRLVGFGGRTLGDDKAKYINTAETSRFHKGDLLYGLFQGRRAIRDGSRAVLVEGYFDVLGAAAAGVEGAVATMGTALTPEQARLLGRYAEEVVVAYDGDEAGERAHRRALPILLGEGMAVYRARFPDGHDPDSLRLAEGAPAVVRAVSGAADAVLAEIEQLVPEGARDEPRLQARAASDLGELLGRIPDPVLRFSYGRRAADRLDLPVEVLLQRVPGGSPAARARGGGDTGAGGPGAGGRGDVAQSSVGAGVLAEPPGPPRTVRTTEERLLDLLLNAADGATEGGGAELPPPEELPPPDVFFDPECRNIYRVWTALYRESGAGSAPSARAVLAALGDQGAAVDRMARLLVGGKTGGKTAGGNTAGNTGAANQSGPAGPALPDCLDRLTRRWLQQRLKGLSREIADAQRAGDRARLDHLVTEKTDLSRRLHRSP